MGTDGWYSLLFCAANKRSGAFSPNIPAGLRARVASLFDLGLVCSITVVRRGIIRLSSLSRPAKCLYTTIKYMRGASGIGMGTKIKHLRRTASGAAGNGLGATMKYLRRTTSAAANNGMSTTTIPPCSAASFEVNSEPHTGAHPSVRLCVGP
jgi:hypothetical protein